MLQGGSLEKEAVAGVAAGAASRIVVAPFDVLKIRFQLQHAPVGPAPLIRSLSPLANDVHTGRTYTSISQAVSRIVKEEGIVGMWRFVRSLSLGRLQ